MFGTTEEQIEDAYEKKNRTIKKKIINISEVMFKSLYRYHAYSNIAFI